jgi:hypothetical protein
LLIYHNRRALGGFRAYLIPSGRALKRLARSRSRRSSIAVCFLFVFDQNNFGVVAIRAPERALVVARFGRFDVSNADRDTALTTIWIDE